MALDGQRLQAERLEEQLRHTRKLQRGKIVSVMSQYSQAGGF